MFGLEANKGNFQLRAFAIYAGLLWIGVCGIAFADGIRVKGVTPEFTALITKCAPTVHPETMAALISAESRGHQYAIADAGPRELPWAQRKHLVHSYYMASENTAVALALKLIASGHTVSLGLTQVNDRNLTLFGVTVRDVFNPCTNLAIGGKIITEFYDKALQQFGPGPGALWAAISAYNSGDWVRGARDGYVNLVINQRGKPLALKIQGSSPVLMPAGVKDVDGERVFVMSSNVFEMSE